MSRPFVVSTGELFRHPGARQQVVLVGPLSGVALSTSRLTDDDIHADLTLEAQGSTLTVTGRVVARWTGECRRCLATTGGELAIDLREIFEPHPVEGETYRLHADHVDLEPALREALALALPLAPLCDEACAGPDPDDHPVTVEDGDDRPSANGTDGAPPDPRWSALDALRFDR
ncbi:MAG TPA: YceD family protein [Acidimicrobiales bacterium]